MAYKTTIECVTNSSVGFSVIQRTYSTYDARVALYNAQGTLIETDTDEIRQFAGLTADTDYILKTVFMEDGEIVDVIPSTEVSFHTKALAYYTPVIDTLEAGKVKVAAMQDSIWMPNTSGLEGFGIGVELCDAEGTVIDSHSETPYTFTGISPDKEYIVRAYAWEGGTTEVSRIKSATLEGTSVIVDDYKLAVFAFPRAHGVDLHVRLQYFNAPSSFTVSVNGEDRNMEDKSNKVHVVTFVQLDSDSAYTAEVHVVDGGKDYAKIITFNTLELPLVESERAEYRFKDFWIAVGEPGAYSNSMSYSSPFAMSKEYNAKIKHAPYSLMPKIKNVVVQSWKDEDGDDVWLPRKSGGSIGTYESAITHEAVEYSAKFVIYGDKDEVDSNTSLYNLLNRIEGRWLKIFDEYTQIGYEGAYLLDVDDDPTFKRRNYDHIEFTLKFKVNSANIFNVFEDLFGA